MTAQVSLLHRTVYHYDRPVQLGPQWIRLCPMPAPGRAPPAFTLRIEPAPLTLHWLNDVLGNATARMTLGGRLEALSIEVGLQLDLTARNPFDFVLDPSCTTWPFTYDAQDAAALHLFLAAEPAGPLLQAMRDQTPEQAETVSLLLSIGASVCRTVEYIVRMEPGVWSPEQTLQARTGSCRDSAWLLVQLLRLHGIAGRFVSGYLVQTPDDDSENAELHAWAEAYLPGAGWIGIDATSGLLTAAGHIALAAAPEPDRAAPLQGTVEPCTVHLETSMSVRRLAP
jgi:transglutaminase-like putative cysteine protease